jgi:membrane-associated phospholipid phosphatase
VPAAPSALARPALPGGKPLLSLPHELPWLGLGLAGLGAAELTGATGDAAALDRLPLDPAVVDLAVDRAVVGSRSHAADAASNVLVATLVTLPLAYALGDAVWRAAHGRRHALEILGRDGLVVGETMLLDVVLFEMTKSAVARPRPYTYLPDLGGYERTPDSVRSFFSGHSATAFAGATSLSMLFTLKHPEAPLAAKIAVWGVSYLLAGTTALLRVAAGMHFWTDVAVGTLVGIAVGAIVPLAHGDLARDE